MSSVAIDRARAGDEAAFTELTDPYRRELQLHCYRILGSVQDAEDMLQETMLAAWRGIDQFEGRASVRAWLYRIATNRCLNALRDSGRRPEEVLMRTDLPEPTRIGEVLWLEPYPDVMLEDESGPEAHYDAKESVALAFVTALQHLPPRQRAVLVLREVLGFNAAEVALMLDTSEVSINSALQRARTTLDTRMPGRERERAPLPSSPRERELVERFVEAFTASDVAGVVALLTEDALLTMPPEPLEYIGLDAIGRFLDNRWGAVGRRPAKAVPTRANGQPAFGYYLGDPAAPLLRWSGLVVLTLEGDRISGLTRFGDSATAARFGMPRTLPLAERRP
jgi:RNA polymerase sigma-70 factor (TIGR02960 family)